MTLSPDDVDQVQSLIVTALTNYRTSPDGRVRRGQVVGFNAVTREASVIVDGDEVASMITSVLPIDLLPGQRVQITYNLPHGATVTGLVSPPPTTPTPVYPEAVGVAVFGSINVPNAVLTTYTGLTVFGSDPLGFYNAGTGNFTIPAGRQGIYVMSVAIDQGGIGAARQLVEIVGPGPTIWRTPFGNTNDDHAAVSTSFAAGAGSAYAGRGYQNSGGSVPTNIVIQMWQARPTP